MLKQYSKLEVLNPNFQESVELGEFIEIELENGGFPTSLPTSADWGYVFRVHSPKYAFDVFIILENGNQNLFKIGIEPEKNTLNIFKGNIVIENQRLRWALDVIVELKLRSQRPTWYTKNEWKEKFNSDFFD